MKATQMQANDWLGWAFLLAALVGWTSNASAEPLLGDMNGDGLVDNDDVPFFTQALSDRNSFEVAFPAVDADLNGDFDSNGLLDMGDVGAFSAAVAGIGASSVPSPVTASDVQIFLSPFVTINNSVTVGVPEIDVSSGGSGQLGLWIIPGSGAPLSGVDLNLIVENDLSNTIDFTGATINNPSFGGTQRWFDDSNGTGIVGTRVSLIDDSNFTVGDEMRLRGVTTLGISAPGVGLGLGASGDPDDDLSGTSYLFAVIDFDILDTAGMSDLYLQIGDKGIADTNGLVTSVILGDSDDPPLDASDLGDRNMDSATADALLVGVPEPATAVLMISTGLITCGLGRIGPRGRKRLR